MCKCCIATYTSVGCAACYIVISVWGIVMLGIMALLFGPIGHPGNIGDLVHTDKENCRTLWINVILYFVLCVLCTFTLFYRLKHPFQEEKVVDEEDSEEILGIKDEQPAQEKVEDRK
ncbi:hypothetical protein TVAG_237950 [Trichomonas vaginalis G3]|uniref:Transmembrane protein n=1 Tax=Trichomonas vaginalis (strain ATCC PRA-98 / G3) TaxID=412133 RepID=A2DCZ5_TRIV3|nr:ribonuclease kappa family [Trichomonas vaginalis G3]EAY21769.1 hypothetical protein TVAG_237950 [Trichomonas vaginalis G3]KAI5524259.1 ribonuclease kappa family [Trichomonas vaginalis G3]|eukprot:XP_001582755.1 hypothetical protein [Trichomonas vaginalis G3]